MRTVAFLLCLALSALDVSAGTGRIVIVNSDPAGIGFNDPTPLAPVGGNAGTTLGQQRLNVFEAAADRWNQMIETNVDVVIQARFSPIAGCTSTEAILGQARTSQWKRDFKNVPLPGVWYPIALANALAGEDLHVGPDIEIWFNADVDNAVCLGERDWYYGLDGNHGDDSDLFVVVLHEIAHGLGMSSASSGASFSGGVPSVFDTRTFDLSAGRNWAQMSEQERRSSLTNTARLVWDGPKVREQAARLLQPITVFSISEPSVIAGSYDIGEASFGPSPTLVPFSGRIVQAVDEVNTDGPTATDGCTVFSNAASVNGNVAVVDRGTCTFVVKARNAQAAGATALVILDNRHETCMPPGMGGEAEDIAIPVISLGARDALVVKAQLGPDGPMVRGSVRKDSTQLAGASKEGYVRLYAPCTNEPGSSKHHWDTPAQPNLLMEPSVNSDLLHGVDLTVYLLHDLGWNPPARTGRRALRR